MSGGHVGVASMLDEISRYRPLTEAETDRLILAMRHESVDYPSFACGHKKSPRNTISMGGKRTRCRKCNKAACKARRRRAAEARAS